MIRHLRHADIDKAWWDACLLRCENRLWYARSWVLDIANPGWEALIDDDSGAIMPLTWRRKYGVDYLFNPYGLQQLGVFAPQMDDLLTGAFLTSLPKRFHYVDIWLNAAMRPGPDGRARVSPNTDQVLLTDKSIDVLRAGYAKGHRRNLRKANTPPLNITEDIDARSFIQFFERTTGARFGGSPAGSLPVLERIIEQGLRLGEANLRGLWIDGSLAAAACFITWEGRSILLKSANDERGQLRMAMFHLTDQWIAGYAGSGTLLDLAGSNTPSVARFNAGFGATSVTYFRYRANHLPWPLRWIKT